MSIASYAVGVLLEDFKTARNKFLNSGGSPQEVDELIRVFKDLKSRGKLRGEQADIDRYPHISALEQAVASVAGTESKGEVERRAAAGAKRILDNSDWSVYQIFNLDAARKYGRGTKWCISSTKTGPDGSPGEDAWNLYSAEEILFFISKRLPPTNKNYKIAMVGRVKEGLTKRVELEQLSRKWNSVSARLVQSMRLDPEAINNCKEWGWSMDEYVHHAMPELMHNFFRRFGVGGQDNRSDFEVSGECRNAANGLILVADVEKITGITSRELLRALQ